MKLFNILIGGMFFFSACDSFKIKSSSIPSAYSAVLDKADEMVKIKAVESIRITDSLLKDTSLKQENEPTLVKLYQIQEKAFIQLDQYDSLFDRSEKLRIAAAAIGDSTSIYESLVNLYHGAPYNYINNAGKYYPGAIKHFQLTKDKYKEGVVSSIYAIYLESKNEYNEAQRHFLKSYDLFDQLDSVMAKATVCNSIGNNYARINSLDASTKYHKQAIEIASKINYNKCVASALMNIGINFRRTNSDSALFYYRASLSQITPKGMERFKVKLTYNMANLFLDQNKLDSAEAIFNQVLTYSKAAKFYEGISMAEDGIASIKAQKRQYNDAVLHYQTAIKVFDSIGQVQSSLMIMPSLIEVYKSKGDLVNALKLAELKSKLNDSLLSEEKQVAVHKLELGFQNEKKELENQSLRNNLMLHRSYILALIIAVIILFYILKSRKKLFVQLERTYEVLIDKYKQEKEIRQNLEQKSVAASNETSTTSVNLYDRVVDLYQTEKPFLNPKLKVEDISEKLNTTQKDLLSALKSAGFSNFNAFTNKFRVEEVRLLFENPAYDQFKLESIALESGFATKPTFYAAFELYTGMKPGYYRSQINK